MVARAQIDGGEIFRHRAVFCRSSGAIRIEHELRLDRLAHRAIALHSADDLHPLVDVVRRAYDAFEGVAAHAIEQHRLLLFSTGDAHHPFGIAELAGEVAGFIEFQIDFGGLLRDNIPGCRPPELLTRRAERGSVTTWAEPAFGKRQGA